MPRIKEASRALLAQWTPQAISEGWTIHQLGKRCHCGSRAAGEALRAYRGEMQTATAATAEGMAGMMRTEATRIRAALLGRMPKLEVALDCALRAAEKSGDARQLAAVVKAFGELWKLGREASGLALVEDVAKAGAIAAAKSEPALLSPFEMVVEFVGDGGAS